jgi:hypothetical protein
MNTNEELKEEEEVTFTHDIVRLIHRTLREMIAMYPEPQSQLIAHPSIPKTERNPLSKRAASRPPASAAPQSISPSPQPTMLMDPGKTRLKFELEDARLELRLQKADWTDERLRLIPEESLAALAYSLSTGLKMEFRNDKGSFLAYWRRLRAV